MATLRCRAIAGPANNQLADDGVADALNDHGILWAPDFVVNAGGVIYGSAMEFEGCTREDALSRVGAVAGSLEAVFSAARQHTITPLAAARRVADERLKPPVAAGLRWPRRASLGGGSVQAARRPLALVPPVVHDRNGTAEDPLLERRRVVDVR